MDVAPFTLVLTVLVFAALALLAVVRPGRLRVTVPVLLLMGAVVYLIPALLTSSQDNPDIYNLRYTGELVRSGEFVYTAERPVAFLSFHPYLPLEMYIAAAASWLGEQTPLTFAFWLKLPAIAAAVGTALLLHNAMGRLAGPWPGAVALLFLVNPLLVGMTAYYGQFDAIVLFFAFAAWYRLRFATSGWHIALAGVLLGLAITTKTWPLVLLPVFVLTMTGSLSARAGFVAASLTVPIAAAFSYAWAMGEPVGDVIEEVRSYNGVPGLYGLSLVLERLPGVGSDSTLEWILQHGRNALLIALAVAFTLGALFRKESAAFAMLMLLAFYVFTPGSVHTYYIWVLPFALIAGQTVLVIGLTSLLTADMMWSPIYSYNWSFPAASADVAYALGLAVWVFTAVWLLWELLPATLMRSRERPPTAPAGGRSLALGRSGS
jgi:Glycosyltransferase family 87